jgi:hypothetical protein
MQVDTANRKQDAQTRAVILQQYLQQQHQSLPLCSQLPRGMAGYRRRRAPVGDRLNDLASPTQMRFCLTYSGAVRTTQRDAIGGQRDAGAPHKHAIRRAFHLQMGNKQVSLNAHPDEGGAIFSKPIGDEQSYWSGQADDRAPMAEVIAQRYRENGYRFVPLVCEDFSLLCSLRILFLRRDVPASVISAGDIDNRLKTIIDALRRPRNANELVGNETPGAGEDPFYVLLDDDKEVTHLEVETDTLLDSPSGSADDRARAHLVITVDIRPHNLTYFNLSSQ